MSLHGRLDALARRARESGYFTDAAPCRACGWPRPRAPRFVEVEVLPDQEPARCPSCAGHVDQAGNALAGGHTTIVLVG